MSKKIKILIFVITVLFILFASTIFAWFVGDENVQTSGIEGGILTQYFYAGDGSAEHPYEIVLPIHYYNLVMLYQKLDGFSDENYHFQIGHNFGNGYQVGNYVNGQLVYSNILDMSIYDEMLPIGTSDIPFGGDLDGNNLTISGLNIVAAQDNINTADLGVFGYVSTDAAVHDLYLKNVTINVDGLTDDHTNHGTYGYVGYLAGHVETSTCFTNVYLNVCTIQGKTSGNDSKSDWGIFGYCTDADTLENFVNNAAGIDIGWGGSFNSKIYTDLLYNLNHSTDSQTSNSFSGSGGYVVNKTSSATTNPASNAVIYRLRDGSYIPLKFEDITHTKAAMNNTGYLVGSNLIGVNASPKISSYKMVNIANAIGNTAYNNLQTAYKADNITYTDSKLEILTYYDGGWKRIKDSHNANNNSTNSQITRYTRVNVEDFGFVKYEASRNALQEVLESSTFIHGIHFDNNQISTSNLLTIPANIARINGQTISTAYQVPKGSIDFNLKEKGYINFFAGTYNSSNVSLNFFSLYKVERNGGTITALNEISKIYGDGNGGYLYQYVGGNKPFGAGDLVFDVKTVLGGNAPVGNMMYYFEIPVNAGEYAMGVSGSTQGAYLIYLDLGANGNDDEELVNTFETIEYRDATDTADNSIALITYENAQNIDISITTSYDDSELKYYINIAADAPLEVKVTLLNSDYIIIVNNNVTINTIKTEIININ